jgi:hypothetical protein
MNIDDLTISYEETIAAFSDEKLLEELEVLTVLPDDTYKGQRMRLRACRKEILKRMGD